MIRFYVPKKGWVNRWGSCNLETPYCLGDNTEKVIVDEIDNEICDMINGAPLAPWKFFEHRGAVLCWFHRSLGKEISILNYVV